MARNNYITNSFVAGQVSPKFQGRTDTSQYNQSCEELFNAIVSPQGGAGRRTGTIIKREVKASDGTSMAEGRVFPFYTTDGQRIPLIITPQFGNTVLKYWQASATEFVTLDPGTLAGYPLETIGGSYYPAKVIIGLYNVPIDLARMQYAQSADVMYFAHEGWPPFEIRYIATNPSGKKFIFRVLPNFLGQFYRDFAEKGMPADAVGFWREQPFMPAVINAVSVGADIKLVAGAGAFGPYTLEANTPLAFGRTVFIDSTWVNKFMKLTKGLTSVIVWVQSVTGDVATVLICSVYGTGATPAASSTTVYGGSVVDNYYEDCYWDGVKGYPRTVTFFEGRLIFGGTRTFPDMLFFSMVNNIYRFDQRRVPNDADFSSPIVTTDPFTATLKNTGRFNEIRWMLPAKTITVGTNFGEFIVQGTSQSKTIGIDNFASSQETPHGSSETQAVKVANATVFLSRTKRQLRELVYSFDEASYKAANLNLVAEDIALRNISPIPFKENDGYLIEMAYQEAPNGLLWCRDTNGRLACITRERDQEVLAWHSHKLGGESKLTVFNANNNTWSHSDYSPFVTSIAVLQRAADAQHFNGEPDQLYMLVKRGINKGGTLPYFDDGLGLNYEQRLFLEVLADEWTKPTITAGWDADSQVAPVYMDFTYFTRSALVTAGVIGPLPHGVGDKVVAIADGRYLGEFTVGTDRKINILTALAGDTFYQLIVGYNYLADIVPVTPEVPATTGSSQAESRRTDRMTIFFHRTIGCKFGRKADDQQVQTPFYEMEEIIFNLKTTADGNPPHVPMFTGPKVVQMPLGVEIKPRLLIRSHLPFPMYVTHVVSRMAVSEG